METPKTVSLREVSFGHVSRLTTSWSGQSWSRCWWVMGTVRPPRWPSGWGVRLESGRSRVRIPLAPGFFRGRVIPVTSKLALQWLYPARRLALQGQHWDWSARCQYTVTGWGWKVDLQLLSQCGSTVNCLSRIRPWDTLACCWDVKEPTNQQILLERMIMALKGAIQDFHNLLTAQSFVRKLLSSAEPSGHQRVCPSERCPLAMFLAWQHHGVGCLGAAVGD